MDFYSCNDSYRSHFMFAITYTRCILLLPLEHMNRQFLEVHLQVSVDMDNCQVYIWANRIKF